MKTTNALLRQIRRVLAQIEQHPDDYHGLLIATAQQMPPEGCFRVEVAQVGTALGLRAIAEEHGKQAAAAAPCRIKGEETNDEPRH